MIGRAYCSAQALCVAFTMLLAACGGGGGGSASDPSTAPGLTVSPASISFTAVHDGADPPTWLDYQNRGRLTGSGNNWTYTAAIVSTSLAPGTYTTTLSLGIADANRNVLAFRDVQVSYTVSSIGASPSALNFSHV